MLRTSAFYFLAVRFLVFYRRNLKRLTKLQFTEIGLCKRFVKNTDIDELATMRECVRVMTTLFIQFSLVKLVKLFCLIFH